MNAYIVVEVPPDSRNRLMSLAKAMIPGVGSEDGLGAALSRC
jgi:hypothetical protein